MGYRFRSGARLPKGLDAEVIAGELARIAETEGNLQPTIVVDEARPKNAPLHPAFEWNDKKAGEEYRIHQARNLIRSVQVVQPDSTETAPMFVNVRKDATEESHYQLTTIVVQSEDQTARALSILTEKLSAASRALEDFQRVAGASGTPSAALIALAASALATAKDAIARIH